MSPGVFVMRKALLAALVIHASTTVAADPTVWVFTAGRLPALQNVNQADRLFVLDHADNALQRLSFPNPGNNTAAKDRAMVILQSPRGQAAIARMRNSAEATAVAWQHGIEKLPAILVDEEYVVYGVFDVAFAVEQVARYRDAR
jgi:integrating conjugative element protein (TIGR03757 family)